ncbi:MAG: EamA family transporter [Pseudomonadota bacterium]|nr:EamA family transporter [Pseudomonadota bacterium]
MPGAEWAAWVIAGSVVLHVVWNLLARYVPSECNFLWWGLLTHLVLLGPWSLYRLVVDARWESTLILTLLITMTANAAYFLGLRRAYHHAPVAFVYPIARSSPLLIAFWGWLFFRERLGPGVWMGIAVSVVGLLFLASTARRDHERAALPWIILAALSTSIYSLSDKVAVDYLPGFGAQLGFVTAGYFASFVALTLHHRYHHPAWVPRCRPKLLYVLTGGLFIGTAYALVIHAMQWISAAHAVAYTNAGIVIATLLSMTLFKERAHWGKRLVAAGMVVAGLIIVGLAERPAAVPAQLAAG